MMRLRAPRVLPRPPSRTSPFSFPLSLAFFVQVRAAIAARAENGLCCALLAVDGDDAWRRRRVLLDDAAQGASG